MNHLATGRKGEDLAAQWLEQRGYAIMHKNWRHKHLELDIIAAKNDVLHFVEVKTRKSIRYGYPEEGVNPKKLNNLISAAEEFQIQYPHWKRIQFDIISIVLQPQKEPQFFLFADIS